MDMDGWEESMREMEMPRCDLRADLASILGLDTAPGAGRRGCGQTTPFAGTARAAHPSTWTPKHKRPAKTLDLL